jgi:hypothetical protein
MGRLASGFGDRWLAFGVGLACVFVLSWPSVSAAQDGPGLAGRWTLNPDLSQFPRELGFGVDWAKAGARGAEPSPGAGPGGGGTGSFLGRPESQDEARRKQILTDEVRTPSTRLTIVETASTVTISDDRGRMRTFRPDGRENTLDLDGVPVVVSARREGGRLQVVYRVAQGRELRYVFSRVQNPPQLVVEVQFVERGGGDRVRRVYEPATEPERPATSGTAPPESPRASGAAPASGRAAAEPFDQRPDAALKGLTRLGVVVEGLGSQAAACGLTDAAVEAAVSARLADAGLRVVRNSDEDTYLYVNVISGSLPNGCVSRYDVILYTHTTATLSYRDGPVLVQVSLLNKGGIAGGAPAGHGATVLRGVEEYVDAFVARIRDANK